MRLLVCEFITGGGLLNADLPVSLAREGELMLQQVLADLGACDAVRHIDVLRDPRLAPVMKDKCTSMPVNLDFMQAFRRSCDHADAVLPIAPESGQTLLRLTDIIENSCSQLLASRSDAVALAGSKRRTISQLEQAGLPVVPVYTLAEAVSRPAQTWVIKPDDGVGGEACRCLTALTAEVADNMIIQPYVAGKAASLTLLCADGDMVLVAMNEQYIQLDESGCHLSGIRINGLDADYQSMAQLAASVVAAIPGLWGWVGIDLVQTETGPRVLEINPRMTTAYAGLGRSLGGNPAEWLLELAVGGTLPDISAMAGRPVEVMLA